ncbi:hypothetical protein [Microbacterium sp. SORGH_AS_0428]|uniref:hypothetical protein n=1 Tax=Microbacterium sp. SORGH_AS_0428 TaxID=3041788 RepID=UPI00286A1F05|nr:hypothetical protein [Microbacterium sp. SORGH_AS_0428]
MSQQQPDLRLKTVRPSVYLDQWVWIRLAKANTGSPLDPADLGLLERIKSAAAKGVAFPLSATHYEETGRILDPAQRKSISRVMAPIAMGRTIRHRPDLVRHQLLVGLHEMVGRPTFLPPPPRVLGIGVHWAFRGVEGFMTVVDADDAPLRSVSRNWLRRLNQFCEFELMAGPANAALPDLIKDGYVMPRDYETAQGNRLEWEQSFTSQAATTKSRELLRIKLLARELTHECGETLTTILNEYKLPLSAVVYGTEAQSRARMVQFSELIPTLVIAADMKREIFRNPAREWTWNMLRDIDALSIAIPYCHAVVTDRDAAAIASLTRAPARYGTTVISNLYDLPDVLDNLTTLANSQAEDLSDWTTVGPGEGFSTVPPEQLTELPEGCRIRLLDRDGKLVPPPRDTSN